MKLLGIAIFLGGFALTGWGLYRAYQAVMEAEANLGNYHYTPQTSMGGEWIAGMVLMGLAVIILGLAFREPKPKPDAKSNP